MKLEPQVVVGSHSGVVVADLEVVETGQAQVAEEKIAVVVAVEQLLKSRSKKWIRVLPQLEKAQGVPSC